MRLLVAVQRLHEGGGPIAAVAMANAVAEQGISVLLVGVDGPSRQRLNPDVEYVPLSNAGKVAVPGVIWRVAKTIRRFQPTVIHAHGAGIGVIIRTAALAAGKHVPQVMTHHSAVLLRVPPRFLPIGAFFVRNFSDHLISIATWKQPYLERIGKGKVPVTFLPNFIDVSLIQERIRMIDKSAVRREIGIPDHTRVVTFIARLVPRKGLESFVRIMAQYAEGDGPPVVGLIVGDGPLMEDANILATKLAAPVRFVGYQQDIASSLAITDVVVFPSERETLPTVILESAAAGLPVICSDIPGHREIIENGITGFLVEREEQYPDIIKRLLEDSELAARIGHNCHELILKIFDKPAVLPQLLELYRLLELRPPKTNSDSHQ